MVLGCHFFMSHDVGVFIYLHTARLAAMAAYNVTRINEQSKEHRPVPSLPNRYTPAHSPTERTLH